MDPDGVLHHRTGSEIASLSDEQSIAIHNVWALDSHPKVVGPAFCATW